MTFTVIQTVTTVTALPYFNKTVLKYGQKLSITKDNKIKGHKNGTAEHKPYIILHLCDQAPNLKNAPTSNNQPPYISYKNTNKHQCHLPPTLSTKKIILTMRLI